jgi:alpha-beta hydrolase superfamily lysophospholipase
VRRPRLRRTLRLIEDAPAPVSLAIGFAVLLLGAFIVTRPLTSLWLLAVLVGLSAILSGLLGLADAEADHRAAVGMEGDAPSGRASAIRVWNRVICILWIVGGIAVLVWLGRSIELLPSVLSVLLILGGLGSLVGVTSGRVSERVLAVASGAAQIVFGILALLWPDLTLLIAAVLFGIRTLVYGVSLIWRAGRRLARAPGAPEVGRSRRNTVMLDAGRYALAVVLVVLSASAWWVNTWLADGAPVVDAFYDAPADAPDEPGVLIRSDAYFGTAPAGGKVQRILYSTTDAVGVRAVASALVISPIDSPSGAHPVISWNWGTTGVARGCAPSLLDATATRWAIPAVEQALARGWVIVASDYTGRGADGRFPYLIGEGEARSSLDAVRAARDLEGVRLSSDVVVWGHSQGGHAALFTEPVAAEYAPELRILGTAALSPLADPLAMARELTRRDASAELSIMVSWVLVPYANMYPDVNVEDYVATSGRAIVREMTQRCLSEPGLFVSAITSLGVSADEPLYPANLTGGPLGRRLAQNTATGPWESPLLIGWSLQDEVIPPELTQSFVEGLCESGVAVRWVPYLRGDHRSLIVPSSPFLPTLMRWTEARFERERSLVSDCARVAG